MFYVGEEFYGLLCVRVVVLKNMQPTHAHTHTHTGVDTTRRKGALYQNPQTWW